MVNIPCFLKILLDPINIDSPELHISIHMAVRTFIMCAVNGDLEQHRVRLNRRSVSGSFKLYVAILVPVETEYLFASVNLSYGAK